MIFSIFSPFPFIFSIKIQTKWEVVIGKEDDLQNSWKKISTLSTWMVNGAHIPKSNKQKSAIMKHPNVRACRPQP